MEQNNQFYQEAALTLSFPRKRKCLLFISIFLFIMVSFLSAQAPDTSSAQKVRNVDAGKKTLPEIQLKEYTILGLEKVLLPQKIRAQIFKEVKIQWLDNQQIRQKEPPSIAFRFSRVKPSLMQLYEFPKFDTRLHYGSFNTAGIAVSSQFKADSFLPYFLADYLKSDGHTDNARQTSTGLQGGIHYQFGGQQLLHLGTKYKFNKQGIWGDWDVYETEWEIKNALWRSFAILEQRWNEVFNTKIEGVYLSDEHENAFQYSDRGWDLSGTVSAQFNNTRLEGDVEYQKTDLSVTDGNLTHISNDSTGFKDSRVTLFGGQFALQQKWEILTFRAGILYRKSSEKYPTGEAEEIENSFTYPQLSIEAGLSGWAKISAAYRPAVEMRRLRSIVKDLPFSDLNNIRVVNHKSRFESTLEIQLPKGLLLNLSGSLGRAENYTAAIAPADSLEANFYQGGYPGWVFGTLDEVKINEFRVRLRWKILPQVHLSGWANFSDSEIEKCSVSTASPVGNTLPYLPDFSGEGSIAWNFYLEHKVLLSFKYIGRRYDDIQNQTQLDDYFLFNARLDLALKRNFHLFVIGRNLLNVEYEEWRSFSAPGINGTVGLKIVL